MPPDNGFPLRLIAPGWYGIANAKWLKRIEVRDRRFESLLMGRDYVTIREEDHNGETVWAETSVGRARLKSAPARVTQIGRRLSDRRCRLGRADRPGRGEDRRRAVDAGDHRPQRRGGIRLEDLVPRLAESVCRESTPSPRGRSIQAGNVQPAMDDPWIAKKHTYWESNGQVTRRVQIG